MGKYTDRNKKWELLQSYPLLIAFIYPLSFIAFFLMSHKSRCKKWMIMGAVYMILLWAPFYSPLTDITMSVSLLSYFVCIIHAFLIRKEYLIRLDTFLNSNRPDEEKQQIKEKIRDEYLAQKTPFSSKPTPSSKPAPPQQNGSLGQEYLHKIRQLNLAISDEVMSDYLNEMEMICEKIFEYINKYPEKSPLIKSFTNYHLPEALKLLEAYGELSRQPIKGSNIEKSMANIEEMLAMIIQASKNLYNNLYTDQAFDIATDVKVLKASLAQSCLIDGEGNFNI